MKDRKPRRKARPNLPVAFVDKDGPEAARLYWAGRPAVERVDAVTFLRSQYFVLRGYKRPPRLERVGFIRDRRG
ncbi:MAG: hypothetical protein AAB339_09670 [Elusimicrobiota bacterium]